MTVATISVVPGPCRLAIGRPHELLAGLPLPRIGR